MKIIYAEVITIGDEILYGQITDTNTQFISAELVKIGIKTLRKTSIGDQKSEILNILKESTERADIIIITGGLGPTKDDITKKTLAEFFDDTLVIEPRAAEFLKDFFEKRGRTLTDLNLQQAAIPSRSTYLHNATGTAPGMWFEYNGKIIVSLPGVPFEMKYLLTNEVLPRLKKHFETPLIIHKNIRTMGLGESFLSEKIADWEDNLPENIKLAYLPGSGQVKLRLTALGTDQESIEKQLQNETEKLKPLIGEYIFSFNDETLEEVLAALLVNNNETLAVAESCTGGNISHVITLMPGSSKYFLGGVVSYSNYSKNKILAVKQETLTNFGAVSEQTVIEMADGVRKSLGANYGIATSGIAGPDGGTEDKPVGTIWIAVSSNTETVAKKFVLTPQRAVNIQFGSMIALNMLRKMILNIKN